jgi:citrate lyase subunit beta / citryl-CoA lyase
MQTVHCSPIWRSILFVPPHVERYVVKAIASGADAVILDLEDGVALRDKMSARAAVSSAAPLLSSQGIDVLVRLNSDASTLQQDLSYCGGPGITGFVLPKVASARQIRHLESLMLAQHSRQSLLLPMIETPRALLELAGLLDCGPRIVGLALGDEDLSAAIGCDPRSETLQLARQLLVLAAAAQERASFALISSNFSDLDSYRAACQRARMQGLSGGLCIHPAQISVVNEAFTPTAAEIAAAERVLAASSGDGATAVDGAMIDRPVAARAAALLRRARSITQRGHSKHCDPGSLRS